MHEVSLMKNLFKMIDTYSREYRLKNITRVVIRLGKLANADPDALQFAFEAVSPGTVAEGADFIIEHVEPRSRCTVCGHEFASSVMMRSCPECGEPADYIEGREMYLQTLEGDQEEEEHGN
jgi:hydrogenase nickel incorporation protein HypA/HybF